MSEIKDLARKVVRLYAEGQCAFDKELNATLVELGDQAASIANMIELDSQERNTILAALRFYQERGQGEPSNRSDWIHDLATNGDEDISMDDEGIDGLCERINLD